MLHIHACFYAHTNTYLKQINTWEKISVAKCEQVVNLGKKYRNIQCLLH